MVKQVFFVILFFWGLYGLYAQSLTTDFSIQSTACINENIRVTNLSANASETNWDFCENDLLASPSFVDMGVVGNAGGLIDLRLANDNGSWYGFVCDGAGMKLKKLFFGNSLSNVPVQTDVANFNLPAGVEIVKFQDNWFGIVATYLEPSELFVLQFGNSLSNSPTIAKANLPAGSIVSSRSLSVVQENNDLIVFVANRSQPAITRVNFGNSFLNVNPTVDLIDVPSSYLFGIDVIEANSNKYMILTDFSNNGIINKLSFGTDWKSEAPTIETVSTGATSIPYPTTVNWQFEGGNYYAFVALNSGGFYKLNFGADLTNNSPTIQGIAPFGDMNNVNGMHVVRNDGHFTAIFSSYSTNKIYRIDFVDPTCSASTSYFEGSTPPVVTYSDAGVKPVTIRTKGEGLKSDRLTKNITINPTQAPEIDINIINKQCLSSPNEFDVNSADVLTDYHWNFGDGQSSSIASPTHSYLGNGIFIVDLEVTGANGCKNRLQDQIIVNSSPDFLIPAISPICTGVSYDFVNQTSFDTNYEPTWEWSLNGIITTNEKMLTSSFSSTGPQEIKLSSSNDGCTNSATKIFNVTGMGSITDFSVPAICEQVQTQFVNNSDGDVVSVNWDFGDGSSSIDMNPKHVYAIANTYTVKLTTINSGGCTNGTEKQIKAYSKPQPDFSIELPPFSCSGTPSQFTNTTPNPIDSNIASWAWSFGDENNGTAPDKYPLYTYSNPGDYNVSLIATSNFNCSATITKLITIQQGPPINFTNTPACVNQGTRFTDESGSDIKAWFWVIGNSTYSFSNPTHVFSAANNYNAQLTVTGNNDCVATLTKVVKVPIPPILSFSFSNACEGQATTFQDTSPQASDSVKSISWDFVGNRKDGSPATYSFESAGKYAVAMNSTQQSGCVYAISKNVVIAPTPQAKFAASPEWGVPPLTVHFTNQSIGASTYLWNFNDKNNSTSAEVSPNFQFTDLGDYVVDLTAINAQNCSNTASAKISVIIPSLDLELKELNLIKDPASGVYRVMVTIKNRSNFVLTSADVVVDISGNARIKETINASILPDGEVSQLLTNQIIPSSLFTYLCAELDVANDLDMLNNKKCEPVSDESVIFLPYPNPSAGQFQFDWISLSEETAHVSIFNSTGQIVVEHDITAIAGVLTQAKFDLRSYSDGTYFFRFNTKSLSKTIPITIVR